MSRQARRVPRIFVMTAIVPARRSHPHPALGCSYLVRSPRSGRLEPRSMAMEALAARCSGILRPSRRGLRPLLRMRRKRMAQAVLQSARGRAAGTRGGRMATPVSPDAALQPSIPLMVRSPRSGRLEPRSMAMEGIDVACSGILRPSRRGLRPLLRMRTVWVARAVLRPEGGDPLGMRTLRVAQAGIAAGGAPYPAAGRWHAGKDDLDFSGSRRR